MPLRRGEFVLGSTVERLFSPYGQGGSNPPAPQPPANDTNFIVLQGYGVQSSDQKVATQGYGSP